MNVISKGKSRRVDSLQWMLSISLNLRLFFNNHPELLTDKCLKEFGSGEYGLYESYDNINELIEVLEEYRKYIN